MSIIKQAITRPANQEVIKNLLNLVCIEPHKIEHAFKIVRTPIASSTGIVSAYVLTIHNLIYVFQP